MSSTLRDIAESVRRGAVALAAGLAVAGSAASLAVPGVIGDGVSRLVGGEPELYGTLAAVVALLALRLTMEIGSTLAVGHERYRLIAELRSTWHARALGLPPGADSDEQRQEWVSILSYDIPRIAEVIVDMPVALTRAIVTLAGTLVLMAAIQPVLTALVFIAAPISYVIARLAVHALRERSARFWDLEVDLMTKAENAFRASWAIQAFVQEPRYVSAFDQLAGEARDAGVAHVRLLATIGPLIQFVTFCGMVVIVLFAATDFGGTLPPGQLLSFVLYGLLLSAPLRAFADSWSSWQETEATLGRLTALESALPTPAGGTRVLDNPVGTIELTGVTFAWREDALLQGASMRIEAGERVALVGENGAGKTTLIALLLGFASPSSGEILVDGVPLDELETTARRRLFAVAPQHAALFGGTIRENVGFARPDATDDELRGALARAQGLEFVDSLPNGLSTRIGDGGLQLSGGQRQRIAIARALLTDAPILVLDEATSGFDAQSSARFARDLAKLGSRTVVWITHELGPLDAVDRVFDLTAGRFVERELAERRAG